MTLTCDSPKTAPSTGNDKPTDRTQIYEAAAMAVFIVLTVLFASDVAPALGEKSSEARRKTRRTSASSTKSPGQIDRGDVGYDAAFLFRQNAPRVPFINEIHGPTFHLMGA
jgi:hypothetical protein